jgi:hypothetical protein
MGKLKWTPDGPQSTFTGPSSPDVILHWVRERLAVQRGEGCTDEVIRRGRFCCVHRQDDRGTRWLHEHWLEPHRDDPDAIFFLSLVYRACINDGRVASEISVPFPWGAERYLAEMRARKAEGKPTEHHGHHAYTIYAYRGFETKFEGQVDCLLHPAWTAREHFRPKASDSCATFYDRLRELTGVGSFIAGQVVADCKFFAPLRNVPDVMTFAVPGPGSERGLARVMGKPLTYYENNARQWQRDFDALREQLAPELEHILGAPMSASDFQSALCETDKFERYRVDHGTLQLYTPFGEKAPKQARRPAAPAVKAEPALPPVQHAIPELTAQRDSNAPHILFRDIETRSTRDLKSCGAYVYAADPTTEVICIAYAVDAEPMQLWIPGDPIPSEFIEAARNSNWTVCAHNDQFESSIEQLILHPRFDWPLVPLERHRCTLAMACAASIPAQLDKAAAALGLEQRKDAAGHRVMRLLSRPKPGGDWYDNESQLRRLYDYCRQDVETERALFYKLPPLSDSEQALWTLDQRINARGFYADGSLIRAALGVVEIAHRELENELRRITGGTVANVSQTERIISWLAKQNCVVKDVQKGTLKQALRRKALTPETRRVIELRLAGAHAAAAKPARLLEWQGTDGRVRGAFRFHGASTGRWTSLGVQIQNLKREGDNLGPDVVAAIASGDLERVRALAPQPLELIGGIARAMICAKPGARLIIADFSGIESRVTAWVSGQQSKLDQWAKFDQTQDLNDDPYFMLGRRLGLPPEQARAIGKTADLAFGYMGGAGAWARLAPEEDASDEAQVKRYQQAWRAARPRTVELWYALDRAALAAVRTRGKIFPCGRVAFRCDDSFLQLRLPNGRKLSYATPSLITTDRGNIAASFKSYDQGRWDACRHGHGAYGGVWVENLVQAVARDLLAEAMQRLEAAGYTIVLHVHDEIVAEVPHGFGSEEEFRRLMLELPAWATGLPLAAKVRTGERYSKTTAPIAAAPEIDVAPAITESGIVNAETAEIGTETEPNGAAEPTTAPESIQPAVGFSGAAEIPGEVEKRTSGHLWGSQSQHNPPPAEPQATRGDDHDTGTTWGGNGYARHSSDGNRHGDSGPKRGSLTAQWVYANFDGSNYLRVDRHDLPNGARHFFQHRWTGAGWALGVKGTYAEAKIPYRLPQLIAALRANPDAELQICEGEKDADTTARLGFIATTNPGGALSWTPELTAWLHSLGVRRAVIHEDNDEKGRERTKRLGAALSGFIKLRVVRYPDVPEGEDVTWWLEHGHTKEELLARIEAAELAAPELDEWDAGELLKSGPPAPRQWLLSRYFCRGFLSGLVAPGAAGKTTLRLTQAIELAAERELLGHRIYQRCRVLVVSLEDDRAELLRRLTAVCLRHHIDLAELKGWLFCRELTGVKLVELHKGERRLGKLATMLEDVIKRRRPDLIVLDPFVKLHALEENSNSDMDFVCDHLVQIAQRHNIAIDCPAHTRKGQAVAGDADLRRGASAQRDAGRLDYTLTVMSEEEAKRFGIPPDDRKSYVRLDSAKVNIVRAMKAEWFRLVNVNLGNATELYPDGDDVQAIESWTPPEIWEGITAEMINAILDNLDAGMPNGQRYSDHNRAGERAAWLVVKRHCPDKSEAQCREIIKEWVTQGTLFSKECDDPVHRKKVLGLYVDNSKRN